MAVEWSVERDSPVPKLHRVGAGSGPHPDIVEALDLVRMLEPDECLVIELGALEVAPMTLSAYLAREFGSRVTTRADWRTNRLRVWRV